MRLRTKIALYLVVFIFLILASLQLTKALIIQPSFQDWEKQECNKGIAQSLNTLGYQLGSLGGQLRDYSSWDDTYDFVQYGNQEYVESNFVDSTFIDLNLNIIAIVNNNKSIRYCQSFDLGNSAKVQTSEETRRAIVSDNSLWTFSLNETTISGIMLMDSKAMFVATAPILSSLSQGPAMGGMLFGKYIDAQEVNKFTKIMGLNFSLHTLSDFRLQKENDQIVESFLQNEQTVVVREESPDIVSGYALVRDIDSNPMFVLQVSQDRIVFKQGVWVGNIFLASELLLATIFGIAVLLTLERKLIKPLTELANYVEQASLNPNASTPKTNPTSSKEMAVLTDAVRNTLKRKLEGMNEVSRMVAHDLRNPLSGIKTSVYLLSKYNEPEMADKRNTLLKTIVDCVEYFFYQPFLAHYTYLRDIRKS